MDSLPKTLLALVLLLVVALTGAGIVSTNVDASNAEHYLADVTAEIEDSNFSSEIINSCIDKVANRGADEETGGNYEQLTVVQIDTDGDGITDAADLSLSYRYTIPFLNIGQSEHIVTSFIR